MYTLPQPTWPPESATSTSGRYATCLPSPCCTSVNTFRDEVEVLRLPTWPADQNSLHRSNRHILQCNANISSTNTHCHSFKHIIIIWNRNRYMGNSTNHAAEQHLLCKTQTHMERETKSSSSLRLRHVPISFRFLLLLLLLFVLQPPCHHSTYIYIPHVVLTGPRSQHTFNTTILYVYVCVCVCVGVYLRMYNDPFLILL